MLKVFLDTNIILDFVLARDGEQVAAELFNKAGEGKIQLFVSFLTMANTAYVARRGHTQDELYAVLKSLNNMVTILPMDSSQFECALSQKVTDFEDLLQFVCASTYSCDVIITNNIKHFSFSSLPVQTPSVFLKNTR